MDFQGAAGTITPTAKKQAGGIMTQRVRPLHDRVIVKRLEEQEQTKGGIIIPDTAKEKPQEALVVAVGPGRHDDGNDRQSHGEIARADRPERGLEERAVRAGGHEGRRAGHVVQRLESEHRPQHPRRPRLPHVAAKAFHGARSGEAFNRSSMVT